MLKHSRLKFLSIAAAALLLAACNGTGDKIGSTVQGSRIAVMEKDAAITADKDVQNDVPQIAESSANGNWAQAGYEPAHMMPNAAIGAKPKGLWTANIGNGSDSDYKLLARPVVNNGMVYTMDARGLVRAFNAANGEMKWELDTTPTDADDPAIGGGLGADGGMIFATTGFGEVVAIHAEDGSVKWRKSLHNPVRAAPTISDGRVYAVSIDNQISTLNEETGDVLWTQNGISESATLMGASSPAVLGDNVIVAYTSGEIFNLRAENGRASWSYALTTPTQVGALPAIADIRGLPVIDRGHIFAIGHSGRMASIDQRTGDRDWEADIGGINTPIVSGDTIFILSNDGQLVALTRDSGRVRWVKELQHLSDPSDHSSDPVFWTGPVLAGGTLWMTNSMNQLAGFSPRDGSTDAVIDLGEPCYVTPVIANGVIYVVTDDGTLIAMR